MNAPDVVVVAPTQAHVAEAIVSLSRRLAEGDDADARAVASASLDLLARCAVALADCRMCNGRASRYEHGAFYCADHGIGGA